MPLMPLMDTIATGSLFVIAGTALLAALLSVPTWFTAEHRAAPAVNRRLAYLLAAWFGAEACAVGGLLFGFGWAQVAALAAWASVGLLNGGVWLVFARRIADGRLASAHAAALNTHRVRVEEELRIAAAEGAIEESVIQLVRAALTAGEDITVAVQQASARASARVVGMPSQADLAAALERYGEADFMLTDLEHLGAVIYSIELGATPEADAIVYSYGRAQTDQDRYNLEGPHAIIGTNMLQWPTPEAYLACRAFLLENPDKMVVHQAPKWIKPSLVSYVTVQKAGARMRLVGVAMPNPGFRDLAVWSPDA